LATADVARGHLLRAFQSLGAGDVPSELDAASLCEAAGVPPSLLPTAESVAALGALFDASAAGGGGVLREELEGEGEEEAEAEGGGGGGGGSGVGGGGAGGGAPPALSLGSNVKGFLLWNLFVTHMYFF
jgi:hypothetical protein